jgi:sterol desaturase/sphingolipid hydroxylase (fatty acid hydroxylase superfamily)
MAQTPVAPGQTTYVCLGLGGIEVEESKLEISILKRVIAALLWPGLLSGCIALDAIAINSASPLLYFNLLYFSLAAVLFFLERTMPFERSWLASDGQIGADIAHTLLSKGVIQIFVAAITVMGLAQAVDAGPSGFWPTAWPVAAQVTLALIVAEAGLYAAHRLAHEWRRLWLFHAVHHSVTKLWIVNTGRFHFIDTIASVALSQPLLYLAGAPRPMFLWVAAITAFIGIMTHCNVDMRSGILNWIFNTPELHRWHHSRVSAEGNTNYGENVMLFDHLFKSFYFPARRPPANIGIDEPMAESFWGQLRQPFALQNTPRQET